MHIRSHKRIIKLNTDHTHELSVQIDRRIIGNNSGTQVIRYIGRKPDRLTGRLGDGKPYQLGGIIRIIHGDISHLMLLKASALRFNIPESLHLG